MESVRLVHEFACSPKTFWEYVFFDDAFNQRLFVEHLRFSDWKVVERRDTNEAIDRTLQVVPKVQDIPGPLKSLVGEGLGYRELGHFDRNTEVYTVRIIPTQLADRLTIKGEIHCEPAGAGCCRRVFQLEVAARVFGVGGILERRIVSDLRTSLEQGAAFIAQHLKDRGREAT